MKGKKLFLSRLMNYSGMFNLLSPINRQNLYVLSYHRIYRPPLKTEFNHNVFNHTEDVFYKQMKWFKKNFDVFSESDFLQHIEGKKPLKRRTAMITFDDAYLDNYELAYPILKDLGLPALMFVPTNQIDRTGFAWWDVLAYFANAATVKKVTVMNETFDLTDKEQRKLAIIYLCWQYKILPKDEANTYLERMHEELGVEKTIREVTDLSNKEFMTWDQIKEISKENFAIGSHTLSHEILSNQTLDSQRKELGDSKKILETKLGQVINTIAYPVGKEAHFTADTKALTKELGYKAGFSFIKGYSKSTPSDHFSIPRYELSHSSSLFKAETLLAKIF